MSGVEESAVPRDPQNITVEPPDSSRVELPEPISENEATNFQKNVKVTGMSMEHGKRHYLMQYVTPSETVEELSVPLDKIHEPKLKVRFEEELKELLAKVIPAQSNNETIGDPQEGDIPPSSGEIVSSWDNINEEGESEMEGWTMKRTRFSALVSRSDIADGAEDIDTETSETASKSNKTAPGLLRNPSTLPEIPPAAPASSSREDSQVSGSRKYYMCTLCFEETLELDNLRNRVMKHHGRNLNSEEKIGK